MTPQQFLQEGEYDIEFAFINKLVYGDCNFNKCRIRINVVSLVVQCFLHEYHHAIDPRAGEATVEERANESMRRMTVKQIHQLFDELMEG